MGVVIRGFPDGVVAGFVEGTGGDWTDITATRNAPALDPESHLDDVYFHSEFDYYRLAAQGQTTISHASVAGATTTLLDPIGGVSFTYNGQVVEADHLLVTHGLGYVPRFFCAYNGNMIPHGFPVQRDDANRIRMVCAYATTTAIRLREVGYSTGSALSSASRTYDYLVFETVAQDPDLPLMSGDEGFVQLGRGMIDTTKRMLRVARTGDTPFGILLGPGADWRGGGVKFADAAGSTYTFGPYSGSYSPPSAISLGL